MRRNSRPDGIDPALLEQLLAIGAGAPTIEQKVQLMGVIRSSAARFAALFDQFIVEQLTRGREGLQQAERTHAELRKIVSRLTAAPWHPAVFLGRMDTPQGAVADVLIGSVRRVVAIDAGIELDTLAVGEEVLLGHECNAIVARSPGGGLRRGETATVERVLPDGRCVLRWRDEVVIGGVAAPLDPSSLEPGDRVRWMPTAMLALEKLDGISGREYFVREIPNVAREQVGGQDAALARLCLVLTAQLVDPVRAARHGVDNRQAVLMVGPPGVGKTLMARAAAAELTRLGGRSCRFAVVKPGEWESPWVGETEQKIRDCFRSLQKAATDGPVVLFLDEIEAIGRTRGGATSQHADRFLAALLTELDGFTGRAGVAVVAATNRKDLVDPALLERLSDVEIVVRRPDLRAARAIFAIHLAPSLPYHGGNGTDPHATILEAAVSRLYSPNSEGSELCRLHFRSGTTRTIAVRELMSGRLIRQICRGMCWSAFARDLQGGAPGISLADLDTAITETIGRLRTTLTPRNAHAHLSDLPQDNDVVRVEPIVPRVARPYRYRSAA